MDCIYRVNEYEGNDLIGNYLERDGQPFFNENVAFIQYSVNERFLEYEIKTIDGEVVGYCRWVDNQHQIEHAEIEVIERALKAVYRCASVPCIVNGELADDVLARLYKEVEYEADEIKMP